jgi:hypothetical protein
MPQTRRTITIIIGSVLCAGSILVFYASAHQWLSATPLEDVGHRPNLALIALLGIVALAGGIGFLARALLLHRASQRVVGMSLGITLCVAATLALIYTAQGWTGSISRNDGPIYILAWAVLGVVSLVTFFAGGRAIYDVTRSKRIGPRSGARRTSQSVS